MLRLTFSTVLQHWMGPVEQDEGGSPPRTSRGVAAARRGRAARVRVATRENMLVLVRRARLGCEGLSGVDLKPEDLSLSIQALLYVSGDSRNP